MAAAGAPAQRRKEDHRPCDLHGYLTKRGAAHGRINVSSINTCDWERGGPAEIYLGLPLVLGVQEFWDVDWATVGDRFFVFSAKTRFSQFVLGTLGDALTDTMVPPCLCSGSGLRMRLPGLEQ